MTFLKRYGLSAISLNMLISAFSIQWTILISGFFHLHYDHCAPEGSEIHKRAADAGEEHLLNLDEYCNPNWPWIDINIQTLINADFAVAAVLISFGAVIGVTSPIQLLVMALIEIVLFNVNEIIGRNYIGALDAGDTIFVHMFGAYFGLALSRMIYDSNSLTSDKAGSSRLSDLFSMVKTGKPFFIDKNYYSIIRSALCSCGCTGQVSTLELQPQEMPNRELSSTPTLLSVLLVVQPSLCRLW